MKITKTTTYDIQFRVCAHEGHEGGMSYERYGKDCDDMVSALHLWETARAMQPRDDWQIQLVIDVKAS